MSPLTGLRFAAQAVCDISSECPFLCLLYPLKEGEKKRPRREVCSFFFLAAHRTLVSLLRRDKRSVLPFFFKGSFKGPVREKAHRIRPLKKPSWKETKRGAAAHFLLREKEKSCPFSFKGIFFWRDTLSFLFVSFPHPQKKSGAAHRIQTKEKICVSLPFYFKVLPHGSVVCAFLVSLPSKRNAHRL